MPKKRYNRRKPRTFKEKNRRQPRERYSYELENNILRVLYTSKKPVTSQDLARKIHLKRSANKEFNAVLASLCHARIIHKQDKIYYSLNPAAPLYIGTITLNPRGFGFVSVTQHHAEAKPLNRDVYVASNRLHTARHGDTVLLYVSNVKQDGRAEGTVLAVKERGPDTIAGFYKKEGAGGIVRPDDPRFPFLIEVDPYDYPDLEDGLAVLARIGDQERHKGMVLGEIIEILGSPDNIDVQMRLVIEKYHLPHEFSEAALAEAAQIPEEIPSAADRTDLRQVMHVTIDGETAKDFDDAVCVTQTTSGFRLHVSIADVSHYVRPGSAIDTEAYQRGTSIYFPGRVIPMLPEKLSNNLCSLIPYQDRLAVTAILDFDQQGKLLKKRFCRSIITSHKRLTYTEVHNMVVNSDQHNLEEFQQLLPMLNDAAALARLLLQRRMERGSIGFSLPEAAISLDDEGRISTITRAERNFAHQMIEEFMLAANEAVAETFTRNRRDGIYRIHELPDYAKVMEFSVFAKTLDLQLPDAEISADWFGQVLELCKGTPKEYIVNNLLLRTMQQARYSTDNCGHFALAASDYTHFTSPIRRYPDLLVHRELCALLRERQSGIKINRSRNDLSDQAAFLSTRERTAISSEREMNDRLKMIYMEHHMDEEFSAIVSGVTEFAFYVELLELFISGSVPLETLKDDYYLFDSRNHRLLGETSGRIYQIGDIITVQPREIDKNKNRIIFQPSLMQ